MGQHPCQSADLLRVWISLAEGIHGDGLDDGRVDRPVRGGTDGRQLRQLQAHIQAGLIHRLAKGGIGAVQVRGGAHHQEELGTGGVIGLRARHGDDAGHVLDVVLLEAVFGELALDHVAGAAAAGALRVAALQHEAVDDAVENQAVIEALVHEGNKVVHGVGSLVRVQLQLNDAAVVHRDGHNRVFAHFFASSSTAG